MKRISKYLNLFLLITTLVIPGFVLGQQRAQTPNSSTLWGSNPNRRTRPAPSNGTAAVQRDFSEALKVIEDQYIDGRKLDYNNVFKSSIIGMLRSLDPHSNYFDREEFGITLN